MQLKFNETINIDDIARQFKETFGEALFCNVAPNTDWSIFSLGGGYPLDVHQQTWLSDRYKPNDPTKP
jgi:hypothetical protein